MSRSHHSSSGSDHHAAASFKHTSPYIVHVRTGHLARTAHHNVVSGIRSVTTSPVRTQKVIPPITINQIRSFAVNGNIHRLISFHTFSRLRVKFHKTDKAKISAIRHPQPSIGRIQQKPGVYGIIVFDTIRRSNCHRLRISEIRRLWVKGFVPHRINHAIVSATQSATGGTISHQITVTNPYHIGSSSSPGSHRATVPSPSVFGNQPTSSRTECIILSFTLHNGRRIMNKRLSNLCNNCIHKKCRHKGYSPYPFVSYYHNDFNI